uniref:ANK_REP_REGION domain-containing protein n=1 Tax=Ascaris lumbricoides TaxID=6252 RepID=A0A0M3IPE1_ASCLU
MLSVVGATLTVVIFHYILTFSASRGFSIIFFFSRTSDHDLQYRCLLAKLDFAGEQRLKTAIELVQVASNLNSRELLEAQLILAQEKARAKDFEGAKWVLISMLSSKDFTKLESDEQKSFQQLLVVGNWPVLKRARPLAPLLFSTSLYQPPGWFVSRLGGRFLVLRSPDTSNLVYKTIERLKEVKQLVEHEQAKLYEKIADEFYELDLREVSLDFYKLMLRCAKTIQEQIAASVSVAVTAKELYRYEEAYEYFMKVEMLEAQLNLSNLKRAETAICLANAASNVRSIPNARIMELFEKAESRAVTNTQKIDIYEAMLDFLRKTNAEEDMLKATEEKISETKRMLEEEDKGNENTMRDEDANSDARSSFSDRWDEANDLMIIERCMAEASQRNVEERIKREKDKRINSYGETRLHEAARGDDQQYLKALIAAVCFQIFVLFVPEATQRNVEERIKREKDKRINSYGETRLHEAARSDDQQYLKALIAAGYNVNARDEGGWTPLHEAIGALKLENVRLLLKAGANANLRSREGTLSAEGQPTVSYPTFSLRLL